MSTVTNEMVTRFLGWKLPDDFSPDCGISFDGRGQDARGFDRGWPVGTNLLNDPQARAMLQHVLGASDAGIQKSACELDRVTRSVLSMEKTTGLTFGAALDALKARKRIAREGWNGKGMWLMLVPVDTAEKVSFQFAALYALPWIGMKTADEHFVPWLASQTDMLAEDWRVVE